jgi:hypothetical protein
MHKFTNLYVYIQIYIIYIHLYICTGISIYKYIKLHITQIGHNLVKTRPILMFVTLFSICIQNSTSFVQGKKMLRGL